MIRLHMVLVTTLLFACASLHHAEGEEAKKKKLPGSGTLAYSSISGASTSTVVDSFGGEDLSGEHVAPITGSVARNDATTWTMRVFNNNQDTYLVNVDLIQRDDRGAQVKFVSYSYRLKPGQSEEEIVPMGLNARSAQLVLRSYRNLTDEQRKDE